MYLKKKKNLSCEIHKSLLLDKSTSKNHWAKSAHGHCPFCSWSASSRLHSAKHLNNTAKQLPFHNHISGCTRLSNWIRPGACWCRVEKPPCPSSFRWAGGRCEEDEHDAVRRDLSSRPLVGEGHTQNKKFSEKNQKKKTLHAHPLIKSAHAQTHRHTLMCPHHI